MRVTKGDAYRRFKIYGALGNGWDWLLLYGHGIAEAGFEKRVGTKFLQMKLMKFFSKPDREPIICE